MFPRPAPAVAAPRSPWWHRAALLPAVGALLLARYIWLVGE